jgi:prevent-host-death family protein
MRTINVHEAKSTLSALLVQVEQGEEVVIARNGRPVAKLTRITPPSHREPGSWRTLPGWEAFRYDSAVLAPLTDADLAAEGWL